MRLRAHLHAHHGRDHWRLALTRFRLPQNSNRKGKPKMQSGRTVMIITVITLACAAALAGSPEAEQDDAILAHLHSLVGGEWIVDNTRPDGTVFRARSLYEFGPDGTSVIAKGWLGNADGMVPHGATQIWREPETNASHGTQSKPGGEIRFQAINEEGAIARGHIELATADTLLW